VWGRGETPALRWRCWQWLAGALGGWLSFAWAGLNAHSHTLSPPNPPNQHASAAAIVYAVNSRESFEKARYWVDQLKKNASGSIVMVLVGNKSDLAERREVTEEEGRGFAESHGMLFYESSAKTAANVADVFEGVAMRLTGGGLPVSSSAAAVS